MNAGIFSFDFFHPLFEDIAIYLNVKKCAAVVKKAMIGFNRNAAGLRGQAAEAGTYRGAHPASATRDGIVVSPLKLSR